MKIPQYRYSLFEAWDRKAFRLLKKLGKKNLIKLIGNQAEINQFIITLIRSQKAFQGWRNFLKEVLSQVKENNSIDVRVLNKKYPSKCIKKGLVKWATYKEDKIVSSFLDQLAIKEIRFIGSEKEKVEFVLRFILGQLGHDWEQTILMIWEIVGKRDEIKISRLNKEFRNFDYLGIFRNL